MNSQFDISIFLQLSAAYGSEQLVQFPLMDPKPETPTTSQIPATNPPSASTISHNTPSRYSDHQPQHKQPPRRASKKYVHFYSRAQPRHRHSQEPAPRKKRPTDYTGMFHREVHELIRTHSAELCWTAFRAMRVCSVDRWPCVRRYKVFCAHMGGQFAELLVRREYQHLGSLTQCRCPHTFM